MTTDRPRVLVTVASEQGATMELATSLARFVEQSAAGRGCGLTADQARALRSRPVWLLSSGPIGEPPFPPDEPHDAGLIAASLHAVGHRVLPGRLDKQLLGIGERAMVTAMRAPVGDVRDWVELRGWAEENAASLAGTAAVRSDVPLPAPN
jgi:menaquinone-dependent protoporphyrinogen oxidase